MLVSFKPRGLERFFTARSLAGIQPKHAARLRLILGRLHASTSPPDMKLPGLYFHELVGDRQGIWAVRVRGKWRLTFSFSGQDASAVNYEDYP